MKKPKPNDFESYNEYRRAISAWKRKAKAPLYKKPKPKAKSPRVRKMTEVELMADMRGEPKAKKPRRVVLGVGHPWFTKVGSSVEVDCVFLTRAQNVFTDCPKIDSNGLGNWNRIRLVAEVLK